MTFDASELPAGVIVNMSVWAFFKLDNPDMGVSNTGRFHTNEELVAIPLVLSRWWMRVICIDDVLSLFTEHEQALVRYGLETA